MIRLGACLTVFGAIAACSARGNGPTGASTTAFDAAKVDTNVETQLDARPHEDERADDAGTLDAPDEEDAPALACPPGSVSNFSPAWKPPKPLHSGACNAAQAKLAVDCAFDTSTNPGDCDEFFGDAGNSTCMTCVLSDDFDTSYGPVVLNGIYAVLNLGGCIAAMSGDATASSCGAKVQAITDCQEYACSACADPASNPQALANYMQCQKVAASTVCAPYVSAGACADALIQPGAAAASCADGNNTFLDRARSLARLFCAP